MNEEPSISPILSLNILTALNPTADILFCVCRKLNEDDSMRGGVKSMRMESE